MAKWQRWKNIMKAYPFEEKRLLKWQPPYIIQPKYDGFRCRVVPTETGHLLLSSEENIFFSVPHLNKMFDTLNLNLELDGELYVHGLNFDEISSLVSRTVNIHPGYNIVEFHCFDIITNTPQTERLLKLETLKGLHRNLQIAPFYICESLDDIMRTYDLLIKNGYEGIIVRNINNLYERKRSTLVMKFKPKKGDTYEIVDYVEEVSINGQPKDSLGALVCASGDGQTFNVGTGFTQEQRQTLWKSKELLPGKVCKVAYQHLTDKKVPRFPVFVTIT